MDEEQMITGAFDDNTLQYKGLFAATAVLLYDESKSEKNRQAALIS